MIIHFPIQPLPPVRRRSELRAVAALSARCAAVLGCGLALAAHAQTATFDFDTGAPPLATYQNLPADQTAAGVTAHFRAASGGFSVQTPSSLGGLKLSMFTNHVVAPINHTGSVLDIQFSEWMTNITFAFATIQSPPIENETPIQLTAYTNSAATPPVGVTNATGLYGGPTGTDTWPMGTLNFSSSVPFNLVRINVPTIVPRPPTGQATDFVVDNITVARAGGPTCTLTASVAPAGSGSITGAGGYSVGLTATLAATPNLGFAFVNYAEDGVPVSSSPSYSFVTSTNRTLVANFTPMYTIATSVSALGGGATSGNGTYPGGSNVTVVATPDPGYAFLGWMENAAVVSYSASYSFAASTNRTLVANFAPQLAIALAGAGSVVVSWPASAAGFVPLQNAVCTATNDWVDVTNTVSSGGGRKQFTVSPATSNCFFRLRHP